MEIKKENVVKAYMAGDDNTQKNVTEKQAEKRPIMERVKSFEDACRELGEDNALVIHYRNFIKENGEKDISMADIVAYMKLRIVCAALNEGWEPQFTEDERRWYPWHYLWMAEELADKDEEWKRSCALIDTGDYRQEGFAGFSFAYSRYVPWGTGTSFGSRLYLKNLALANYCGKQFIELWADFNLIRRK